MENEKDKAEDELKRDRRALEDYRQKSVQLERDNRCMAKDFEELSGEMSTLRRDLDEKSSKIRNLSKMSEQEISTKMNEKDRLLRDSESKIHNLEAELKRERSENDAKKRDAARLQDEIDAKKRALEDKTRAFGSLVEDKNKLEETLTKEKRDA